jgi:hypothetical protein
MKAGAAELLAVGTAVVIEPESAAIQQWSKSNGGR